MDIQKFIAEFKKTFVYDLLSRTLTDEQLFEHAIDDDGVTWFKEQMRQIWQLWNTSKAQPIMQWIDVNERMPEQGQKVLIYRPFSHEKPHGDPNFKIATYCGEGIWINSHFKHEITHWMPITSPPEELPFI